MMAEVEEKMINKMVSRFATDVLIVGAYILLVFVLVRWLRVMDWVF